jgi:lipopolysaccharide biosynthesis regulator YciM
VAARLESSNHGSFATRQTHYLCERAEAEVAAGQPQAALQMLERARELAPQSPRPLIEQAQLLAQQGQVPAALQTLLQLREAAPRALPLAAGLMARLAEQSGERARVQQILIEAQQQQPSIDLVQAIVQLEPDPQQARQWFLRHLKTEPSLVAAGRWLSGEALMRDEQAQGAARAIERACGPLMRYRCAACGFEAKQHFWHCPGCQAWDSYPARRIEEL